MWVYTVCYNGMLRKLCKEKKHILIHYVYLNVITTEKMTTYKVAKQVIV